MSDFFKRFAINTSLQMFFLTLAIWVGGFELAAAEEFESVRLAGVSFLEKQPDFGGETCIAMFLWAQGHNVTGDEVLDASGVNPLLGRGCYLCYYLQEKGLLIKYFHQFREHAEEDLSGYETLKAVLGRDDLDQFQKQWEKYVMKLRFGN